MTDFLIAVIALCAFLAGVVRKHNRKQLEGEPKWARI
jgi:hypothetical protein